MEAGAQELLAQFPATVLRAALRGDQWQDVLDAALGAGRDVAAAAPAADPGRRYAARSEPEHDSITVSTQPMPHTSAAQA